ncbi:MAG: MFS transporter [Burkholderiales bacterium]
MAQPAGGAQTGPCGGIIGGVMTHAAITQRAVTTGLSAQIAVYLAGLLQGLTLVSFPASSAVLRQTHGFSDAQYGAIFLPQVALAVIGSVAGALLARRLGLKTLLWIALLANAASQALLAWSASWPASAAYTAILFGTASMGFGFGLSGAPLNAYPPLFFPNRRSTAVVALHTVLGLGLMFGPLYCAWLLAHDAWLWFPLSLFALCLGLALVCAGVRFPDPDATAQPGHAQRQRNETPQGSALFWLFIAIAVLYAFAEGTFANWAVIYLQESKHLPESIAVLALSVFWGALVAGRLLITLLLLRVAAETIWLALPPAMICTFLLLPHANGVLLGIGAFALAGLACSAFFPLTIAISAKHFEGHVAWVSSMLIAALMVGVGLGSFAIGALRNLFALETLYQVSAAYPLLVSTLAFAALRKTAGGTKL